ncbi:hypothetical protein BTJ39_23855 [Izhakiella australiensis]|uniref:Norphogenetic protein n=1 Tax=Izhakiella australiensis TaxID=1926881 RepID=A0A1S8Y6A6_9GAMM|nr:hypothetical protein [Izhakiella australiensis]OON34631.1 hypothetical protein BTJ39_23855 [Izhakiella australiensis]
MTKTFICIASGPSLTAEDCLLAAYSTHPVIAVNSSWAAVPNCQNIYAADFSWWEKYHSDIPPGARCWTSSVSATHRYGLNYFPHPDNESFNSGLRAIQLAIRLGAGRVLLLGYDCSIDASSHWHGDHPVVLKNPDKSSVTRWHAEFSRLAATLSGAEILNCSRRSALECFPLSTIEAALNV